MIEPQPQTHSDRLAVLHRLVQRLQSQYPDIRLIALYGSMGRGEDGPFSDIELFCVIDEPGVDTTYEWIYGPGKAEINVYGWDVARQEARLVDSDWALSKGQFLNARILAGDAGELESLQALALAAPVSERIEHIRDMIVGELYEWTGKLRNAASAGDQVSLTSLACKFAEHIALSLGLFHRFPYKTGMTMLADSLQLPGLPEGYADLCRLVLDGELGDFERVRAAIEAAWSGMVAWSELNGIEIKADEWPF